MSSTTSKVSVSNLNVPVAIDFSLLSMCVMPTMGAEQTLAFCVLAPGTNDPAVSLADGASKRINIPRYSTSMALTLIITSCCIGASMGVPGVMTTPSNMTSMAASANVPSMTGRLLEVSKWSPPAAAMLPSQPPAPLENASTIILLYDDNSSSAGRDVVIAVVLMVISYISAAGSTTYV